MYQYEWAKTAPGSLIIDQNQTAVDCWLHCDGVTQTVDPMKHKSWLHDSNTEQHQQMVATERTYNRADVTRLLAWERSQDNTRDNYITPSTATLNGMDPFPGPCASKLWYWGQGKTALDGKRPAISALIHEGKLPDKSKGQIEAEMRESGRSSAARLFSSGTASGGAVAAA